ncbi:hypothetical protein ACIQ9P_35695 [Kitasatospora sp. NPDC094019]|uniref:hypothetical protein n=1 Tax=Kitasatospora sp. NPDC094019 TaxID=3364091 RepID=UPI0037F17A16
MGETRVSVGDSDGAGQAPEPAAVPDPPASPPQQQVGRPERSQSRVQVITGVVVGALLLVIGVPVALLTTVLQDDLVKEEPRFTARYGQSVGDRGEATVLPSVVGAADIPTSALAGGCTTARSWAHQRGGMDVGSSKIDIEAVGAKDRTVAIRGIRAERVDSPRPPEGGTVIGCMTQGEGAASGVGLDLDSPSPSALAVYQHETVGYAPYFQDRFHYLENQKPEVFAVTAVAAEYSYDYVIRIDGSVDGKETTWTLKDGDRPFRISGIRKDRSNIVYALPVPWTEYATGEAVGPRRCVTTCVAPDGSTVPQPTGVAPPAPPPPAPTRPAVLPPPLSVLPRDAESVAVAWGVASHSSTYTDYASRIAAIERTKPYRTKDSYDKEVREALQAEEPDNPTPPKEEEVVAHKGWRQVRSVRVKVAEDGVGGPPSKLDDAKVRLSVEVRSDVLGEDGWRQTAEGNPEEGNFLVTLARQDDGTYLVAEWEPQ